MGLTRKYFGEQDDRYGGRMTWPGTASGYPVKGDPSQLAMLKEDEFDELEHSVDFQCRMFCTWNEADVREYAWIMDRIANQMFVLRRDDRVYDDKNKGWRIWLEWAQIFGMPPKQSDRDLVHSLVDANDTQNGKSAIISLNGKKS